MDKWWRPQFKTKKALQDAIREIANKAYIGESLSHDDEEFMLYVFSRHDGFSEKCGCGFSHIFVDLDEFGGRHFRIARVDGTDVGISWHHALSPRSSERTHFMSALREEVKEQIFSFKASSGNVCGICGGEISSGDKHIDHLIPFRSLVDQFFGQNIHPTQKLDTTSILSNRQVAKDWSSFHQENAILQPAHAKCNMRKG